MKDVWHEVLRDKHESFKWSLLIDTAIETVRKHKQDYLLSKYGVAEPSQRKINRGEINYDEPLFCSSKKPYNRLGTNGLERQIRLLGRSVGVENVHPHRFRRTFATKMINKGMPLEKVQMLLGHGSPETTMIYVNVSDKGLAYDFNRYID